MHYKDGSEAREGDPVSEQFLMLTPEMQTWMEGQATAPEAINPCVRVFGRGAEGVTCKTCVHLFYHTYSRRFWKCDLRVLTHGRGSDHRVRWPACGRYEEGRLKN
jgi:hypothetical protein